MFRSRLAKILIVIVATSLVVALYLAWMLGTFSGTNVAFQSSDGEWADSEVLFKGRDYASILSRFEDYRDRCAPSAALQRTTNRPEWYDLEHWFNDYTAPKWRVPYAPVLPNARDGYYPPVFAEHCANGDPVIKLGPNNSFKPKPLRGSA